MKESLIISRAADLAEQLQQHWDCDAFFSGLMQIYGTAASSINRALRGDPTFFPHGQVRAPGTMRSDLLVPNRAYFRFLCHDEDVREAVDLVRQQPEFNNPKARLQFIICASPGMLCIYDVVEDICNSFPLSQLPSYYSTLLPLTGTYQRAPRVEGAEADARACSRLTRLLEDLQVYNKLTGTDEQAEGEENKPAVHALHDFIRRVLFCLFAEDTGIFAPNQFTEAFTRLTDKQGRSAGQFFTDLFEVLNTPEELRAQIGRPIAREIMAFPYVNGGLFRDTSYIPEFNLATRAQLIDCGRLRWQEISPAIFGAMFQNAMDEHKRRELGAHYTSEENILKVINPLFMDKLNDEFEQIKAKHATASRRRALMAFQDKLASLKFMDPACGCGNFLIIAYRQLRRLENKVLDELFTDGFVVLADAIKVNINQFYGIEIEDWPAEIAHLSMWLMQHVMNQETAQKFGINVPSIPLTTSATIVCTNALTTDWNTVLPAEQCSFLLGNPPFAGTTNTSSEQKEWLRLVYPPKSKIGRVDFVSAWFVKASDYMAANRQIEAAFVATNSICQGMQPGVLWDLLLKRGIKINFAWPTFTWKNAGGKSAAVFCVIVGFSYQERLRKYLFYREKDHISRNLAEGISPYLIPSANPIIVQAKSQRINAPLNLKFGNMPADDGNLILSIREQKELLEAYPEAEPFIKKFKGSEEIINGTWRFCLWLKNEEEYNSISHIPEIKKRIEACRAFRLKSTRSTTVKNAQIPWRFQEVNAGNPKSAIVIPRVSSERRPYIPMDTIGDDVIIGDSCFIIPQADAYSFGILTSRLHMCWMRLTSGKLKSDYRYSRDMTYNTFVWPQATAKEKQHITELVYNIIDPREDLHIKDTMAKLYNPDTMPDDIRAAHAELDTAVEKLYRSRPFVNDEERTSFMLKLYADAIARENHEK